MSTFLEWSCDLAMILNGTVVVGHGSARVQYFLTNSTREGVFVASLPTDVRRNTYPASAYCSLSPDGRHVNLILGSSPLPVDCEVEYGVASYFVRAAGGRTIVGGLDLPLPLQEWNGYYPPRRGVGTLVNVLRLLLHVTVVPESRVRWVQPAPALSEYWSVGGDGTIHVLALELDEPLQVWRRNDDFPRPQLGSATSQLC